MNKETILNTLSVTLQGQQPSVEDFTVICAIALDAFALFDEAVALQKDNEELAKENEELFKQIEKMTSDMEEVARDSAELLCSTNQLEAAHAKASEFYDFMGNLEVETVFGPASMKHVANALFTAKELGEKLKLVNEPEEEVCHCEVCNGDC